MKIVEVREYSDEVLAALNKLMPQLSSSFGTLSQQDLIDIVESEASSLFMAR